ncbi:MAG: hypothetical protein LC725_05025, partial [Lentisphaerae bacterium]|nr:hypothetical protein [Lentisphaerota bacterium]
LVSMQEKFKGELAFRSDPACHIEEISIVNTATGDVLCARTGPGNTAKNGGDKNEDKNRGRK